MDSRSVDSGAARCTESRPWRVPFGFALLLAACAAGVASAANAPSNGNSPT